MSLLVCDRLVFKGISIFQSGWRDVCDSLSVEMKTPTKTSTITTLAIAVAFTPAALLAQDVRVAPVASSKPLPPGNNTTELSAETLSVLRDIRRMSDDREAEIQAALSLESEAEANLILDTILADVQDENAEARTRLSVEQVNRTQRDRDEYVDYITRRLRGEVAIEDAPESFAPRVRYVDPATEEVVVRQPQRRIYKGGRRIITYRTRTEVPPVLLASGKLKRVEVAEVGGSPFRNDLILVDDMPEAYLAPDAYAVSYYVDPATEITRDDILFEQGTTNFADAYSYDIVVDLATAMNDPSLQSQAFVIEGHASAEGEYATNLALSQARAERIVREMIRYGVARERLIPVGYGENEAAFPANAAEPMRATDRRVTVFRMQ